MPDRREILARLMRVIAVSAAWPAIADAPQRAANPPTGRVDAVHTGYGRDPDLHHPFVPWPRTLGEADRAAFARLADLVLPADGGSPSASALGVHDFIDDWISAPYPEQQADRSMFLDGLRYLDAAAGRSFARLGDADATRILDEICDPRTGVHAGAARFFSRFRRICLIGYYTTPAGVAELGYVGYQPSARFEGPPAAVLARLGL